MRVVEIVESAAHICVMLAVLPPSKGMPAAKLAEFHDLSATSVAKQLQQLSAAGLVVGTTGRTGGYRLAKAPNKITLLAIVQAVEGDIDGFQCREIRQNGPCAGDPCEYKAPCAIAAAMKRAEAAWRASLSKTTLADITRGLAKQLPDKIITSTQSWMERSIR